jgi:transcriptional regulator with XRE-family HTH domain
MNQGLTPTAAKELGRSLRFVRQAREMSLREAAKASGVSYQYIMDIELGMRGNPTDDIYYRLASALRIPTPTIDNLLLRGRIASALELRGLNLDQRNIVWTAVELRLTELGIDVKGSLRDVIVGIVG